MYDVIVWMVSVGLKVRFGFEPPAIVTIIVSPIAREMANTNDAIIPDNAEGKTTFNDTSNFVEPSANAPSRIERGTALIASSDNDAIIGIIIIPTTIPGLNAL